MKFNKTKPYLSNYSINYNVSKFNRILLLPSGLISDNEFNFLNKKGMVESWNDETKEKLWIYNLHYFDYLNCQGSDLQEPICLKLLSSWIENNPPVHGNGWEPYPLSLRIVNWIKYFSTTIKPSAEFTDNLYLQISFLSQNIEYHLLGNHLFTNGKALVFSGAYFKSKDSSHWLKQGLDILDQEISEQILDDGGNFELSPMYHNIILGDMLDLYNLALISDIPDLTLRKNLWLDVIQKMIYWGEEMAHPDGDVSFFNDSALGIAPTISKLKKYAKELKIEILTPNPRKVTHLKDSGYVVIQDKMSKLIIDCAKVGPDYIPGHAHADTLSFELSLEGYRVFVNSGTSIYSLGEERLRQRKTEAHNSVVVDDKDSSEVWSSFRVAKRAYPSKSVINKSIDGIIVECSHNGFLRLPGRVIHKREWKIRGNELIITDRLNGKFNNANANYHLHPDIQIIEKINNSQIIIKLPNDSQYKVMTFGSVINIVETTWHPEFGLSIPNKKLVLNFKQNEVQLILARVK